MELTDREKSVYIETLSDISSRDLIEAIDDCVKVWRPQFGVNFPPIYDLKDFVTTVVGRRILQEKSNEIINRPDKPLEKSDLTKAAVRLNVTKQQVAEWMEEGKEAQRRHIAQLATDAEWQRLYEAFGKPGLKAREPQVPADPIERGKWARKNAKENGWL